MVTKTLAISLSLMVVMIILMINSIIAMMKFDLFVLDRMNSNYTEDLLENKTSRWIRPVTSNVRKFTLS